MVPVPGQRIVTPHEFGASAACGHGTTATTRYLRLMPAARKRKSTRRTQDATASMQGDSRKGEEVRICFGGRCLDAILTSEASDALGSRSIELHVAESELHRDPPDLTVPFQVYDLPMEQPPDPEGARFGGYVMDLEPAEGSWWAIRSNNLAHLRELRTGGITSKRMAPMELMWTTMRGAGYPPDRLRFHGWNPPTERMIVVVPVEGAEPVGEMDTGTFGLTVDPSVPKLFEDLHHDELMAPFVATGFWAVGAVTSATMFEAEQAAVQEFVRILDRLAVAARYALAELPTGEVRPFRRAHQLEQIRLRPIAGVKGLGSGRMYVRGTEQPRADERVGPSVLTGVGAYIGTSHRRLDHAISAWRRATSEDDPSVAAALLSEAIEAYTAGVKVPKLFSDEDLGALRKALPSGLSVLKSERVGKLIDALNEPPVLMRLREALRRDKVIYTEEEFRLLVTIRGLRNKIVHGQARKLPSEEQMSQALSVVNRMLLFRMRRLGDG